MRHLKAGYKLGRKPAHRRATLRNLVTSVIERERITTTVSRAKAARPLVEHMITLGKRDTLHARRQAAAFLTTAAATKKLFGEIAPRFAERPGGYTRIIRPAFRLGDGHMIRPGWRIGDGAALAVLELVDYKLKKKEKKTRKEEKAEAKKETEAAKS